MVRFILLFGGDVMTSKLTRKQELFVKEYVDELEKIEQELENEGE